MGNAILSRTTNMSKKADLNHKHMPADITTETSILGKLSSFTTQPNRINASNGIYKNGIYFFPGSGVNNYCYVKENEFESGIFTSVSVNPKNYSIYLVDDPDSKTKIYMVSSMLNTGSTNTSMVYAINTNSPDIFEELSFPNTGINPYAIKCFKGLVILFMNGGDIYVSSDKCQSWTKITNFVTDLNIEVSSGGENILIADDTLYICSVKRNTYPNYESYIVYTKDLVNWESASCPDISRFNNMVKFNNMFVLSTSTADKLVTTTDFTEFSIIEGVPSNFVQTTGTTLYSMNENNQRIMKSTKDLKEWTSYKLASGYNSVSYVFGYVGKYILVNDYSDVKRMNYLMDYTEFNPLTISQGGTGATTAENVLLNLGMTATIEELNYVGGVTGNIQTQIDTIKSNFQDGCEGIANAITAEGVFTASNASPDEMATNISEIRSGGDATTENILSGKTAYSGKSYITGAMTNQGAKTLTPMGNNTVTSGEGYYSSVTANGATAYEAGRNSKKLIRKELNFTYDQGYVTDIEGYKTFTVDNFAICECKLTLQTWASGTPTAKTTTVNGSSLSYNASNGNIVCTYQQPEHYISGSTQKMAAKASLDIKMVLYYFG